MAIRLDTAVDVLESIKKEIESKIERLKEEQDNIFFARADNNLKIREKDEAKIGAIAEEIEELDREAAAIELALCNYLREYTIGD